jgi:large subunit ribosomal protein L13
MSTKTTFKGIEASDRSWHVVDASNLPVGRLASEIAQILKGKHKPQYAPHLDVGDHVVVINAGKIQVTSKKPEQKMYYRHSGYPGGIKEESFNALKKRKPELIIEKAVWGMLPKNRLGRAIIKKLHVYSSDTHPHESQNPVELSFKIKKVADNE